MILIQYYSLLEFLIFVVVSFMLKHAKVTMQNVFAIVGLTW